MDNDVKSLAAAARALSPEAQDELLDLLLNDGADSGEDWTAAWSAEADARLAEIQRGDVETFDADDVTTEGRRRLAARRSRA